MKTDTIPNKYLFLRDTLKEFGTLVHLTQGLLEHAVIKAQKYGIYTNRNVNTH